jgi:hypothetical protein
LFVSRVRLRFPHSRRNGPAKANHAAPAQSLVPVDAYSSRRV